eukprot:s658_g14.t7
MICRPCLAAGFRHRWPSLVGGSHRHFLGGLTGSQSAEDPRLTEALESVKRGRIDKALALAKELSTEEFVLVLGAPILDLPFYFPGLYRVDLFYLLPLFVIVKRDATARGEEPHGGSGEMLAVMAVDATGGSPNRTKRAREQETRNGRARDGRGSRRGVDEEDEDDAVPARRPLSPGGDQPVTSREFRALLAQHFAEFSRSWQPMEHRIAGVEQETKSSKQERAVLTSRVTQVERKEADLETKVHDLAKTVEDLKKEGVIQEARSNPVALVSTTVAGDTKNMWVAFPKTTSATVWHNQHKIGSSAHRAPRGDSVKLMSSGWVDVMAAAQATGVTMDVALATFEREL